MLRKWMATLMVLMLVLMLPLTAMADRQYTLTVLPGDMMASEQAVSDVCEASAIRVTKGERSGAVTLLMNEEPMLTIGLSADDSGLFAASKELTDGVLYVGWDDLFALLTDGMIAAYKEAAMDEAAVQTLKTSMDSAKVSIVALFSETAHETPYSAETLINQLKSTEELFPDDPAMVAFVNNLQDNFAVEEGKFFSDVHDTADEKVVFTMNAQDVADLFDTNYMRGILMDTLASSGEEMTDAELQKTANELAAQVKKLYEESDFVLTTAMYSADNGETIVGVDMDASMHVDTQLEGEELQLSIVMYADYNRLSQTQGTSYRGAASIDVDGVAMKAEFDLLTGSDGAAEGMLGLLADCEEVVITYRAEKPIDEKRVRTADVYMRSGATAILKPTASDRPVIGFKLIAEPAAEDVLEALENANDQNSINVLKLSESEMNQLVMNVSSRGMQVFYNVLGAMPTSVLNLLMSSGMLE